MKTKKKQACVQATPIHVGNNIPYIAHQKLTPHIVAVPATRTPRSVIWAELDRINHRSRPHLSYVPKEDFLNDHSIVEFGDEARHIRAQTNSLLRRINTPVIRTSRPLPISLSITYK
ncbi:hypothetical protein J6590_031863 [Homalodisca vitripennis]|nr:hypothetical protein J6590_031863 [Homalodisca vitripennis]